MCQKLLDLVKAFKDTNKNMHWPDFLDHPVYHSPERCTFRVTALPYGLEARFFAYIRHYFLTLSCQTLFMKLFRINNLELAKLCNSMLFVQLC